MWRLFATFPIISRLWRAICHRGRNGVDAHECSLPRAIDAGFAAAVGVEDPEFETNPATFLRKTCTAALVVSRGDKGVGERYRSGPREIVGSLIGRAGAGQ